MKILRYLTTEGRGTVEGYEFYMLCGPVAVSFTTLSCSYQSLRINQTLKSMLRKATAIDGKDWDKLIPYLYCLHIGRYPRRRQGSPLLSSFMAGMCGGLLIF